MNNAWLVRLPSTLVSVKPVATCVRSLYGVVAKLKSSPSTLKPRATVAGVPELNASPRGWVALPSKLQRFISPLA